MTNQSDEKFPNKKKPKKKTRDNLKGKPSRERKAKRRLKGIHLYD